MALVEAWTGRTACVLQAALRLSNESFAQRLGIAVRTVASWHQKPALVPKAEMQQLLDTALERAPEAVRARFEHLTIGGDAPSGVSAGDQEKAHSLQVAVAVVVDQSRVLLVQRRGDDGKGISWQFPAGVIKPGIAPATAAVRETVAETGVHCAVRRTLGRRIHPITSVLCEYLLCEYLGGEAENLDPIENVSVTWAQLDKLTRFIPADYIFPPVLQALEVPPQ